MLIHTDVCIESHRNTQSINLSTQAHPKHRTTSKFAILLNRIPFPNDKIKKSGFYGLREFG